MVSSTGGFSRPVLRRTSGSNAVALAGRGRLSPRSASSQRHPWFTLHAGWGNINPLPIGCAFRPGLRSRLTLGGLTFPRKPCAFGGRASHPSCRYSFRHTHSPPLHGSSPVPLHCRWRRSPTISQCSGLRTECRVKKENSFTQSSALSPGHCLRSATAARRLSPRHFRRGMARPVSCYALLK